MGTYKLASAMMLEMKRQESISRNLAGSSIRGYRGEYLKSAAFDTQLGNALQELGAGKGVDAGELVTSFAQGPVETTGRPLDFALNGVGMFEIVLDDGTPLYTRNGAFVLSPEGLLTTQEGHVVSGANGGAISFPETWDAQDLEATDDGTLQLRKASGKEVLGRLKVVTVADKDALLRATAGYFTLPPDGAQLVQPMDMAECRVLNRALEGSNASPVREMATMIQSLRDFETLQRVMRMRSELGRAERQKLMG